MAASPLPGAAMFDIAVACLVVTALAAWLNVRFIHLPNTIGVMAVAMLLSMLLLGARALGFGTLYAYERAFLASIDFTDVLMQGMLSVLLFAGALHVDVALLRSYRRQVGALAVAGTLASTAIVAGVLFLALPWVGIPLPLLYCLLFGALISPTDPIAVMGVPRTTGAPEDLELVIAGERSGRSAYRRAPPGCSPGVVCAAEFPSPLRCRCRAVRSGTSSLSRTAPSSFRSSARA